MTETGTNCQTKAEDAVAAALAASTSWQQVCEVADSSAAAGFIHVDEVADPDNGYAFTLGELEERRVLALVLGDPDDGFTIAQGEALPHRLIGGQVLVVIERLVRQSEVLGEVNQQRWLKNRLVAIAVEMFTSLTETHGPRWMQAISVKQMPVEITERKQEAIVGRRQQATLAVSWGDPGGDE